MSTNNSLCKYIDQFINLLLNERNPIKYIYTGDKIIAKITTYINNYIISSYNKNSKNELYQYINYVIDTLNNRDVLKIEYNDIIIQTLLFEILKYNTSINRIIYNSYLPDQLYLFDFLKINKTITNLNILRLKQYSESDNSIYIIFKGILEILKTNTSITNLNLTYSINDDNLTLLYDMLKQNNSITQLNLSYNSIISLKELGKILKTNTTLTDLNLNHTKISKISNSFYESLQTNTTLTKLNLKMNRIKVNYYTNPLKALLYNNSLTELNLNGAFSRENNNLINLLNDSLQQNITLTKLNLKNNLIGNDINLLNLKNNISLIDLNLSYNYITEITIFMNNLKYNTTLLKLNLSHNTIYKFADISNFLEKNTTLIKLNLSFNRFRYFKTITNALIKNSTLTNLNLNNIIIDDIKPLCNGLKVNTSLYKLQLNNISCPFNIRSYLLDIIKYNKSLTHFYCMIKCSKDDAQNILYCNETITEFSNVLQLNSTLIDLRI